MIIDVEGLPIEEAKKIIVKEAERSRMKQEQLNALFDNDDFCDTVLAYVKRQRFESL